jgi:hypothetical protein
MNKNKFTKYYDYYGNKIYFGDRLRYIHFNANLTSYVFIIKINSITYSQGLVKYENRIRDLTIIESDIMPIEEHSIINSYENGFYNTKNFLKLFENIEVKNDTTI